MPSRGQSITISYVAWDAAANAGATGDDANHTLKWIKDGTAATPTNTPAEVDATNAPGVYKLVLTGTECTCDSGTLAGKSSTADVVIIPISVTFEQLPTAAPAASGGVATVDGSNRIAGIAGTKNTLDALNDIEAGDVWDEDLSGHATSGTAGAALGDAGSGASASDIADAVWDEDLTGHTTTDSAGEALGDAAAGGGGGPSAGDIADAVWDEALAGHTTTGTAGKVVGANLDAAVSTRSSHAADDIWAVGTRTLTAFSFLTSGGIADAVWDEARAGHTTDGTFGAGVVIDGLSSGERDAIADALLDRANAIEAGVTVRQSFQLIAAATAGVLSANDNGDGTYTVSIRNVGGSTLRILATTDAAGNRTDVALSV